MNTFPNDSGDGFKSISIKEYRNNKRRLKKKEAVNFDSIILTPCSGNQNWHEIAEHSALFYYYEICPKLRLTPKFFADITSCYDPYDLGYIRTVGVDTIRNNLKKANLFASERKEGDFIIFKLNTTYTEERVAELIQAEEKRRYGNLVASPTGPLDPILHQSIVNTSTRLHRVCNSRLDKLSSSVNGAEIIQLSDQLLIGYHQITMFPKIKPDKIVDVLTKMRGDIYSLIIRVQVLGETKLWDLETCVSISEPLYQIRDLIEKDLKKAMRKVNSAKKSRPNGPPAKGVVDQPHQPEQAHSTDIPIKPAAKPNNSTKKLPRRPKQPPIQPDLFL